MAYSSKGSMEGQYDYSKAEYADFQPVFLCLEEERTNNFSNSVRPELSINWKSFSENVDKMSDFIVSQVCRY